LGRGGTASETSVITRVTEICKYFRITKRITFWLFFIWGECSAMPKNTAICGDMQVDFSTFYFNWLFFWSFRTIILIVKGLILLSLVNFSSSVSD
jgi:hypothetical protein